MDEYSRILIEKYCREHPRTKKARILSQLIEMSYDLSCEPSDSDAIELERIIEDERDPELRDALEELDEFLFRCQAATENKGKIENRSVSGRSQCGLPFLFCMTGMPSACGESPHRAQLPTNLIVTPKVCIARYGREEGIAKLQPDEQKPNTKASMMDERANSREIQKAIVTHTGRLGSVVIKLFCNTCG